MRRVRIAEAQPEGEGDCLAGIRSASQVEGQDSHLVAVGANHNRRILPAEVGEECHSRTEPRSGEGGCMVVGMAAAEADTHSPVGHTQVEAGILVDTVDIVDTVVGVEVSSSAEDTLVRDSGCRSLGCQGSTT